MPINFIPNDPLAVQDLPVRKIKPRANRKTGRAGFSFEQTFKEGQYALDTEEFLYWQCREAALWALETWEAIEGKLDQWAETVDGRKKLPVVHIIGGEINAGYTGSRLEFVVHNTETRMTMTGASADVVVHETGHALLDSIRPDLFETNFTETGAFHEAFADCMSLLTALSDKLTRTKLLKATPDLGQPNFVEALMEDMSDGRKRVNGAQDPASEPRRALNNLTWQLPTTLPPSGPPSVLTREVHSFARIFVGCFYDVIRNIFNSLPKQNQTSLQQAAEAAGRILITAARQAPATARFFSSVGKAMVLADQTLNQGAHRQAINDAFNGHGLQLGSSAMLAPEASLEGEAPRLAGGGGRILSPATHNDLRSRIGAARNARLLVNALNIGGEDVAEVINRREISLDKVSNRLRGVVLMAREPVLVGASGMRAAVLSTLPEPTVTTDEVHAFVESLLDNNQIALGAGGGAGGAVMPRLAGRTRSLAALSPESPEPGLPTHGVKVIGGKMVLKRLRYTCGHAFRAGLTRR
ncbi:MAG TPA: hypothetical protein VF723_04360 [Pyrinomonadaceae bacterium]|jgi:hypothetical protein